MLSEMIHDARIGYDGACWAIFAMDDKVRHDGLSARIMDEATYDRRRADRNTSCIKAAYDSGGISLDWWTPDVLMLIRRHSLGYTAERMGGL